MAVFTIGDLHLSLSVDKPMDVFPGWGDYLSRIEKSWREQVMEQDTVVMAGDISWGMTLPQALADFEFIHSLPGKKAIIKGNHDYWWSSRRKMEDFFEKNGLTSLSILHNSFIAANGMALCGTRGWSLEDSSAADKKVIAREEGRLRASLEAAVESGLPPVVFLHYPPLFGEAAAAGMLQIMLDFGVKRCFYGHLHAQSCRLAFEGEYLGINFSLISADHLKFCLKRI